MANGPITQISDLIVPQIFTPYVQNLTEQKSRLIASGAIIRDSAIDGLLAGGGLTFNTPSYRDLDNDEERTSTDSIPAGYTGGTADPDPKKIGTLQETSVRLSRNQSWATADLDSVLTGSDPAGAIANRVADYWVRRQQAAFVATVTGIFADNAAAPTGTEHVQAGDGSRCRPCLAQKRRLEFGMDDWLGCYGRGNCERHGLDAAAMR